MTQIFNQTKLLPVRRKLRSQMTKGEAVLWKHLKNDQLGHRFRRQYGIGNYVVDFYCPILKLVIEIDGLTHADEKVFEKDVIRQKYLEDIKLVVKRYSSADVFNNLQFVLEDIYQTCELLAKRTPPRPLL